MTRLILILILPLATSAQQLKPARVLEETTVRTLPAYQYQWFNYISQDPAIATSTLWQYTCIGGGTYTTASEPSTQKTTLTPTSEEPFWLMRFRKINGAFEPYDFYICFPGGYLTLDPAGYVSCYGDWQLTPVDDIHIQLCGDIPETLDAHIFWIPILFPPAQ